MHIYDRQSIREKGDVRWPLNKNTYATYSIARIVSCSDMRETKGYHTDSSVKNEPFFGLERRPIVEIYDSVSEVT